MKKFKIIVESLPERCEICRSTDLFEPKTGYCSRCDTFTVGSESAIAISTQTTSPSSEAINPNSSKRAKSLLVEKRLDGITIKKLGKYLRICLHDSYYEDWNWFGRLCMLFWSFLSLFIGCGSLVSIFFYPLTGISIPHVLLGLVVFCLFAGFGVYLMVKAFFLHHQFIEVAGKELRGYTSVFLLDHEGFKYGKQAILVSEIDQIYCSQEKCDEGGWFYKLRIRLKSGQEKTFAFADREKSLEKLVLIKQEIENYIAITGQPVNDPTSI